MKKKSYFAPVACIYRLTSTSHIYRRDEEDDSVDEREDEQRNGTVEATDREVEGDDK